VNWDGKKHSYRPSADWRTRVSPDLEFHEGALDEVDPVTYEVIRNRMWASNLAHGETLTRISGSPVFQALDFNMCVLTEDAEVVMNGPFIVYLNMGAPLAIRYIMERLSESPGIEEGDIFLASDPWIGASHQMDVLIAAPVFRDGKLFAWVSNAGHQYDMGGIVPGGWPQNAPDVYSDPTFFSPIKIVERGVLRTDLEGMYQRQSRLPDLLALDLRAQIAGARFAVNSIDEICEQFGADCVKGAMRRILNTTQDAFKDKLERIPDGEWSEVRYLDERMPGDRSTHRVQFNVTKKGDRLIVDNVGTDEQQEGPIGYTYASFSGAVFGCLSVTTLWQQLFAVGGAARQVDMPLVPGVWSCADYPAAVSGGVNNIQNCNNALLLILSRMLSTVPEFKDDVTGSQSDWPLLVLSGENDRGEYVGTGLFDPTAQGSGGKPDRDGTDTAGLAWSPLMRLLNVEDLEQFFPIVYLYRRERTDGGGAGRWRGGVGMDFAFTPYRAKKIEAITNVGGMGISTHGAMGMFGGLPVPTAGFRTLKGTDLRDRFAARELIGNVEELSASEDFPLRGKSNGQPLVEGDVLACTFGGGGGYGDPLEREPWRVRDDVDLGYTSLEAAVEIYGVVLVDGELDEAATEARRRQLHDERSRWRPAVELGGAGEPDEPTPATGEPPREVHEYVVAKDEGNARVLCCARCETRLSDYRGSFKSGLLVDEQPVSILPGVGDPTIFLDDPVTFRRFCCPNCQVMMATEIVRTDEQVLPEMLLR
jgi:N-methylhydantoinase B